MAFEKQTYPSSWAEPVLQAYVLGSVDFEAALAFQRRLVYQVSGERNSAALVLCEHAPLITVGRHGSRANILWDQDDLRIRRWPVRWVNRGGGSMLHLPGQLAIYPIMALDQCGIGLQAYLDRLQDILIAVLDDFSVKGEARPGRAGVWVGRRSIAGIGVAVRDWVAYHGAFLNVNPPLGLYRHLRWTSQEDEAMTSLERERRGPLKPSLVRERLLDHFAQKFGFSRTTLFSSHPSLSRKALADAVVAHP